MDDKQYRALMDIISTSKKKVEGKLAENLEKLWWEVTEVQEWISQELASKFNKSPYQFHWKENEVQFHFNATLLDSLGSAKKELEQLAPSSNGRKNTLKRVVNHLNEGRKAITKRQKHIKTTELIGLWLSYLPGIRYDTNNLASDLDDEKCFKKAKVAKRWAIKKCRGITGNNKCKASNWSDNPAGPSSWKDTSASMMQSGRLSAFPASQRLRVI